MSDVHIDTHSERSQTRSTWRDRSRLHGLLLQVIEQNPNMPREQLRVLFRTEAMRGGEAMAHESFDFFFDIDLRRIERPVRVPRPIDPAALAAANERLEQVVLLDLRMPNGKKLRDCNGKECKEIGGWLSHVGFHIGDDGIVGKKLSEAELAAMRASN